MAVGVKPGQPYLEASTTEILQQWLEKATRTKAMRASTNAAAAPTRRLSGERLGMFIVPIS